LLWYGWGKLGRRREGRAGSVSPIGLVLLTLIALWISPDFAWVSFGVFVALANLLRPRRAVVAVLAVALLTGALLVLRWPGDSHPLAPLIGPVVGALAVRTGRTVRRSRSGSRRPTASGRPVIRRWTPLSC